MPGALGLNPGSEQVTPGLGCDMGHPLCRTVISHSSRAWRTARGQSRPDHLAWPSANMAGLSLLVGPVGAVILALVPGALAGMFCAAVQAPRVGDRDSSGSSPVGAHHTGRGLCSSVPGSLLPHWAEGPWQPVSASWSDGHRPSVEALGEVLVGSQAKAVGCHEIIICPGSPGSQGNLRSL